jgi:hypothetical protein
MTENKESPDPDVEQFLRDFERSRAEMRAKKLQWGRNCFKNALEALEATQNLFEPLSESEKEDFARILEAVDHAKEDPKVPIIDASVAQTLHGLALLNLLNSKIHRFHRNCRLVQPEISIEEITNG